MQIVTNQGAQGMETAFKGIGYKVQIRELSFFHDDYGLEAPEAQDDDEDEDDEDEDEDEDDEDEDDEGGGEDSEGSEAE